MNKLFHGKETFLSMRKAKDEISAFSDKKGLEKITLDCEKIEPDKFSDTLNNTSLFCTQRLVFLKRPYRNKSKEKVIQILLEYLSKKQESTNIIIWEDQKIKSNTKYYKYFQNIKSVEESDELNKRTFLTWANEEVKKQNIALDKNLVKELSERVNFSPESFVNEIQKLKLSGKRILKKEDIIESTTDTLEYDIWKLIDSINSKKDTSERIKILDRILSQEVDENYIISMLARNLRLTVLTKELLEQKKNSNEIASILKIPPFTVPQMQHISREYSREKISLLYEKLSSLDYEIKRGNIEPGLGLTLLITKF